MYAEHWRVPQAVTLVPPAVAVQLRPYTLDTFPDCDYWELPDLLNVWLERMYKNGREDKLREIKQALNI